MRYGTLFGKAVGWAVFILQLLLERAPAAWGCTPPQRRMLWGTRFAPPQGPNCSFLSIPLHQSFLVVGAKCLGLGQRIWREVMLSKDKIHVHCPGGRLQVMLSW